MDTLHEALARERIQSLYVAADQARMRSAFRLLRRAHRAQRRAARLHDRAREAERGRLFAARKGAPQQSRV
jgi:hypothetical protein